MKSFRTIPLQLVLLVFVFGTLALFINSNNLLPYPLFFMGAESIVERGHFYLDGSQTPGFNTIVAAWSDQFLYNGHVYTNKQPGTFLINALPYFFLHKLGITFLKDKILTSGLVTLLSSILMVSLMSVFIFNIVQNITNNKVYGSLAALFFAFGTLILPYSGYTHHQVCATFFLFLSFYLLFQKYNIDSTKSLLKVSIAGFSAALALFCSYNTLGITIALLLYVFLHRSVKDIILFSVFLVVGLLPNCIFNYIIFQNPLSFPYKVAEKTVGGFVLASPNSINHVTNNLYFYLISKKTSILFFSPITAISALGLILLPKKHTAEKITLLLGIVFHIVILLPLGFVGWCQYGPRYLLECTPFAMIGVSGFFTRIKLSTYLTDFEKDLLFVVIIAVGIVSIIICSTGSICGTINCDYYGYAFSNCLQQLIKGRFPQFYFYKWGLLIILISFLFCLLRVSLETEKKVNVE